MKIRIYAINLERSRDRWEELSQQAGALGLELHRVEAVDGASVAKEDWIDWDEKAFKRNNGRWVLPGEYGCYRSHMNALSSFLESGLPSAIIIEDDIGLVADLPDRGAAALAALPQADLIKLFNHRVVGFRCYARSSLGDRIGRAFHGPMGSAACYAVTRAGAAKVLDRLAVMEYPLDIALERGWAIDTEVFAVERDIVRSKRPPSTIATRGVYRTGKFVWWRRIPTHVVRLFDHLRRLKYAVKPLRPAR